MFMDTILSFWLTILAVILGGIITWLVSLLYYKKAAIGLINETKEIRKLLNCVIILEADEKGQFKPKINDEGNIVGLIGSLKGSTKGTSNVSANLTSKK
ncbi:unnamed protein product [marine sediment metagenome]|uniref:Uncharacterized protein n=1 Tax=marine sediment metagenome TaxID=412755 RepID=X1TQI1_9ZZZZ